MKKYKSALHTELLKKWNIAKPLMYLIAPVKFLSLPPCAPSPSSPGRSFVCLLFSVPFPALPMKTTLPRILRTGMTQRDVVGREVGGGFMFGNACTPMVDSCQCMAKPIQYCKVK